jgi:type II restriction/modification system DNA methylase subunit YeeA
VVCDIERFRIHTAWTNTVPETHELTLDELAEPHRREILRNVFHDPEKLRPARTRTALTKEAADKFSTIALRLHGRGSPDDVAHFVNQLVFCFFAHSVKLLPDGLFPKLLRRALQKPERAQSYFNQLFSAMENGGEFDLTDIAWFNGGLFDGRRALSLDDGDIGLLVAAASLDWSQIDPSIFGTLFERFLDPGKRAQIGAHYTDREKITKIIEPVVLRPLASEWITAKAEIERLLDGSIKPPLRKKTRRRMTPHEAAEEAQSRYLERLRKVRILDPACGSGNFLYLALQGVKDIENKANLDCEMLGLRARLPFIGPEIVRGIETNPLAAELARTTIWIGDIQWRLRNGIHARPKPILRKLEAIECRDALITWDKKQERYVEAEWPSAEFVVGNPPFLGAKLMKRKLGAEKTNTYRELYAARLAGFSDLVCFWFEKARTQLIAGASRQVGLVATSSIRGGTNRPILDRITRDFDIFCAWSEEPWVVDGAKVEVSIVCFGAKRGELGERRLNGELVTNINADLTTGLDLSLAKRLSENRNVSFLGIQKSGPLDIGGKFARALMVEPQNPNGLNNSEILKPYWNGDDLTGRPRDYWLIDFPLGLTSKEAALYQSPFKYLAEAKYDPGNPLDERTLPEARAMARDKRAREQWWEPYWPRPELRQKLASMSRYIATAETAEHRLFIWLKPPVLPDKNLIVVAREDDTAFGILQSRFHENWSLRLGTSLEDRPRYTSTTTFETFPFPEGMTLDTPAERYRERAAADRIAGAARHLDKVRNAWLNPLDLVRCEPEIAPRFPDRILPKDVESVSNLKARTLTNLYNERPQWLVDAHRDLDAAVATAYGWPADISDGDALAKLLELNLSRAAASNSLVIGSKVKRKPPTPEQLRRSPQFKLPIAGGKPAEREVPAVKPQSERTTPSRRRRA